MPLAEPLQPAAPASDKVTSDRLLLLLVSKPVRLYLPAFSSVSAAPYARFPPSRSKLEPATQLEKRHRRRLWRDLNETSLSARQADASRRKGLAPSLPRQGLFREKPEVCTATMLLISKHQGQKTGAVAA